MSPRQPRITGSQAVRALRRAGWSVDRQKGSHIQMLHSEKPGLRVTVAVHAGETLKPATLRAILDQAEMTLGEFLKLL